MRYPPCLCIIIIEHCRSYQQNWNTIRLSECWLSCQLDWLSQPLGESKGCHQPFGRHKNGSDAQNLKFETKLNLKFPQQMGIKTFKNSEFTICLGVIPPFHHSPCVFWATESSGPGPSRSATKQRPAHHRSLHKKGQGCGPLEGRVLPPSCHLVKHVKRDMYCWTKMN